MRAVFGPDEGAQQARRSPLAAVLDGSTMDTLRARDVLKQIAEAPHACGDPGLQFDDTVNDWHTCTSP